MSLEQRQQRDLVLFSPSNCEKHSHKIRTVKDVFTLQSKTLGDFRREYGKDWLIGYVSMWLINLNDNSNVKNKMNGAQIEFTSLRIIETYSLRVTDLTLFFRNVKEGIYGPYYENLSQEKIMDWLRQYFDLRCEYAEMYSSGDHEKICMTKDKINPEVAKKMFEGVGQEKTEYDQDKNGLGKRSEKKYKKAKVITNRTNFLNEMFVMTKKLSLDELKQYLIKNDSDSENYDSQVYELVEREIDLRINPPKIEEEKPLRTKSIRKK